MNYYSTRDVSRHSPHTATYAIMNGLAADGGLFLPEALPKLDSGFLQALCAADYPTRAARIMKLFLEEYTDEELLTDCRAAYAEASFPGGAAPIRTVDPQKGIHALELWHGPTAAFKDMALQIMPRLLSRALQKSGEKRTAYILVATSGDTGKAALEGYRDIPQTKMTVFYPVDGVSRVQKLQMASQEGSNVNVFAIQGNFDNAQTGVKEIFGDRVTREKLNEKGYFLSSANSINWGRLLPQVVYYISAWCDLYNRKLISEADTPDVCVPTGNFGDILAAYIAKKMGLPLGKLICASNENHILTDFLRTGVYDRNRVFRLTMSPSMDILISSNLERLLFFVAGAEATCACMTSLKETGKYTVSPSVLQKIQEDFVGFFATEGETAATIRTLWKENHYLSDTHSAVAFHCADVYRRESGSDAQMLVVSTASPFKFANNVYRAVTGQEPENDLAALEALHLATDVEIPYPLAGLDKRPVRFDAVISPSAMTQAVLNG